MSDGPIDMRNLILDDPKEPDLLERDIERHFVKEVEKLGGVVCKLVRKRNWPDRLMLLPNSCMRLVELKRPGQGLRKGQEREFREIEAVTSQMILVFSEKEQIDDFLAQWLREWKMVNELHRPPLDS